jgi:hypothetical protein
MSSFEPVAVAVRRSGRMYESDRVGPVGHVGLVPRRTSGGRLVREPIDASLCEDGLLRSPGEEFVPRAIERDDRVLEPACRGIEFGCRAIER